jgi:GDP-L-fucose synthase
VKIFVAGHRGMVGAALVRRLEREPGVELVLRTRRELDLTDAAAVAAFYAAERPEAAIIAAARVGGIHANAAYPADFLWENLAIGANTIHGAWRAGVGRLLFLGSSCIYPKLAPQPMSEDTLLTGSLEPTNEAYALAKIAGIKLCQAYRREYGANFISAMPTNLYGPEDNFDLETSHVLPALIHRFQLAKEQGHAHVTLWGSGRPLREFLHVDDLAEACLFLLERYDAPEPINVGCGRDISIHDLAEKIRAVTGFAGRIEWDATKPDGTPRKLLDVTRLAKLGWSARIGLDEGIASTYRWWLDHRHPA